MERWNSSFSQYGEGAHLKAFMELPPGCPEHLDIPYAFKAYALRAMWDKGYSSVLWADSSVTALRSLNPIWEHTERLGYWFSDNNGWNCGQWTCDAALPLLGITRQDAFDIPHVAATAFALDFSKLGAVKFFDYYWDGVVNGAFRGPWVNDKGQASADPRVLGHRHDQTVASVAIWRLGMTTTKQPYLFSDGYGERDDTVLKVER
jgi:hypothetical protein